MTTTARAATVSHPSQPFGVKPLPPFAAPASIPLELMVEAPSSIPTEASAGKPIPVSREQSGLQALFRFRGDPLRRFEHARDAVGDVMAFVLRGQKIAILHDPKVIEGVLVTARAHFRKDQFTRQLRQLLGDGLLTSEDDHWRRQRKLMGPAMQPREVQRYVGTMAAATEELVARFGDGEVRNIHADMMHLTLAILGRTLFGERMSGFGEREFEDVERELERIMRAYRPLSELFRSAMPAWLPVPSRWQLARARKRLDVILGRIISVKRGGGDSDDLLSRLMDATDEAGGMTDIDLRDEAMTLFLAGHETTALALTYALRLLAEHPDACARTESELEQVLGGRAPDAEDLSKLPFTRAVIQETLRLYPPAWVIPREAKDDVVVSGWMFPRGIQVFIPLYTIQRDRRWFDEPERFLPERFLPGGAVEQKLERKELPRFVYFPFGAGPRVCIGQHFAVLEAVTALAVLLGRARFALPSAMPLTVQPAITLRPKHPVELRVSRKA